MPSVMIAFPLPPSVAEALYLAQPTELTNAECIASDDMHVTLAYMGETSDVIVTPEQLRGVLVAFAAQHGPISGQINGVGRFATPDEQGRTPVYANFDSPDLPAFHHDLIELLAGVGLTPSQAHGFTPHITLAYLPADDATPEIALPTLPITFTQILLQFGDVGETINLNAAQKSVSDNAIKAISKTDDELRVGNYIVLFDGRDLEGIGSDRINPDGSRGEWFTKATQLDSPYTETGALHVDWEHGIDPDQQHPDVKARAPGRDDVLGFVDWKTAQADDKGVWVQRVLNRRNAYVKWIEDLIEAGMIGNSSEAITDRVEKKANGEIVRWPLRRDTLTIKPMDPRMMTENVITALKALKALPTPEPDSVPATEPANEVAADADTKGKATDTPLATSTPLTTFKTSGVTAMDELIARLKEIIPDMTDEQAKKIAGVISAAMADPAGVLGDGAVPADVAEKMLDADDGEYPTGKALKLVMRAAARVAGIKAAWVGKDPAPTKEAPKTAPAQKSTTRPPYDWSPTKPDDGAEKVEESAAFKAVYQLRYGNDDDAFKAVMADIAGPNYRQFVHEQNIAFAKYMRRGERGLSPDEAKALNVQIYGFNFIKEFVKQGYEVKALKSTMIEAQDTLGGYAVPPNVQQAISMRLPGLTAVRAAGARVVTLFNANSIEIVKQTGGDTRYTGAIRGAWGSGEAATPAEKNATIGLYEVIANLYTFKVPMSQSLVEDASNLVEMVQDEIAVAMAMDEDNAFLVGDGTGKPRGILPSQANAEGLTEVVSLGASTLTTNGIKNLKRGVASQYRGKAAFVGNSDTFGAIELLTVSGTGSDWAFPDLSESELLLKRKTYESEALPDVAANAFPIIFGDFSGYTIVERAGMTIARFQDSATGINKVEFHVRRRVGGRLEKDFQFAVQKVAAS